MLLVGCNILDVVSQKVIDKQFVLIQNNRIAKIAPMHDLGTLQKQLPASCILDVKKRLVMPGMIDAHIHLSVVDGCTQTDTLLENLRASESLKVLYGAKHASDTLHAGFTTVRDVGEGDNRALRDAIDRGVLPGPRIVACGRLGMTAGHGERLGSEWRYNLPVREPDRGVDGPWAVRKKVRKLVGYGCDAIFVFVSSGGYAPHPWNSFWFEGKSYTAAELRALVEEAHAAGRRVAAQSIIDPVGTKNALSANIDTLDHGLFLDNEDVTAMASRGIYYIPMLAVTNKMWNPAQWDRGHYLRLSQKDGKRYLQEQEVSFRKALDFGVKIAMGSDAFRVLKHGDNASELEWMVRAGMSEMEALVAATINAAEALGLKSEVGSVEEGKLADLIIVDPNPLNDVSYLCDRKNIKMIMKNGHIISMDL